MTSEKTVIKVKRFAKELSSLIEKHMNKSSSCEELGAMIFFTLKVSADYAKTFLEADKILPKFLPQDRQLLELIIKAEKECYEHAVKNKSK